jgi:Sec-independent protein translocase protein TatA
MRAESTLLVSRLNVALDRKNLSAEGVEVDEKTLRDGLRVSLSELGKARSAAEENNRDIDESSLPAAIKDLLKRIRELKQQIEAKKAELQAVTGEQSLDPDTQRMKIEALQSELSSLQSALSSTNATLIKTMHEQGLSDQQLQEVTGLLMK